MAKNVKISPSILAGNLTCLKGDIEQINNSSAEMIHLDIMDGNFVNNISFGADMVKSIRSLTKKPLDTHLMVKEPLRYIRDFVNAGSDIITVHKEAFEKNADLIEALKFIKRLGKTPGISISPESSFDDIVPYLEHVKVLLIMSVAPGKCGQPFNPDAIDKVRQAKNYLLKNNITGIQIEVDGGISVQNIRSLADAGVDIVVAGSSVFNEKNSIESNIKYLKSAVL